MKLKIIEHIFKDLRVSFIYIILLQKNKKVNGCYITITFSEIDDLTEEKLNEKIDIL